MMYSFRNATGAIVAVALLALGCYRPAEKPETPATVDTSALVEEWNALYSEEDVSTDPKRATEIASTLLRHGVEHLDPLLEVIADPEAPNSKKIHAVVSLTPIVTKAPSLIPRFTEIINTSKNVASRSSAAHLLSLINDPSVDEALHDIYDSEVDHTVRGAVAIGLLMRDDATMLDEIDEFWTMEETQSSQKSQIMYILQGQPYEKHKDLFILAATDLDLESRVRMLAVNRLGREGGEEAAAALKTAAAKDPSDEIREMATLALKALRQRQQREPQTTEAPSETEGEAPSAATPGEPGAEEPETVPVESDEAAPPAA